MRKASAADVFAVGASLVLAGTGLLGRAGPQRPLPTGDQAKLEAFAREVADAAAARARTWLGNMHPSGQAAFRQWALAVWDWKRERAPGWAPLVAEGVLLDCLDRTQGLYVRFGSGLAVPAPLQTLAEPPRMGRAAELFERALKADPGLIEARFRATRIRALKDAKAVMRLEELAISEANAEIAYLAAVSRALIAQDKRDTAMAARWFEHARSLRPRSTAAAVGLSVLKPRDALDFDSLELEDPFYTYPCRFLTPSVGEELATRIAKLDKRR